VPHPDWDPGWADHRGVASAAPEPGAHTGGYRTLGDFQGPAYDRNAFTAGTEAEVAFLWDELGLDRGMQVLDLGCATGRHAHAVARGGCAVVGVDLSAALLAVAADGPGGYCQADARALPLASSSVDVVLSLCQGGFGVTPCGDQRILAEAARVLCGGGRLALTAYSLAFAARYPVPGDTLDLRRGLHHTVAEVRDVDANARAFDLWSSCYSPGHLACLCAANGLAVEACHGVEPGSYRRKAPTTEDPELLVVARRAS
jgi:SAM-dependent methyltransferase